MAGPLRDTAHEANRRVNVTTPKHLQWDLQDHGAGGVSLDGLLNGHWIVLSDGCMARSERLGRSADGSLIGEGRGQERFDALAPRRYHQQE